jgi:hypothetical protein
MSTDRMTDARALEILNCWCATSRLADDLRAARDHIAARLSQPAAAVPDNVTRTAPRNIWLQVDADDYQDSRDADFQSFNDECTWCSESQGGVEIKYIRADQCAQALAASPPAQIAVPEGWRELMTALADDLDAEINARSDGELPRRIERDLKLVRRARAMLTSATEPPK